MEETYQIIRGPSRGKLNRLMSQKNPILEHILSRQLFMHGRTSKQCLMEELANAFSQNLAVSMLVQAHPQVRLLPHPHLRQLAVGRVVNHPNLPKQITTTTARRKIANLRRNHQIFSNLPLCTPLYHRQLYPMLLRVTFLPHLNHA